MASKGTFAQVPELDLVPVGLWVPLVLTGQSLFCQMPDSLRARQPLWEISPVQVHRCPLVHIPGSPERRSTGSQHSPRLAWSQLPRHGSWLCLLSSRSLTGRSDYLSTPLNLSVGYRPTLHP